jgi:staphylococcal nuclease domain-containing protein 1
MAEADSSYTGKGLVKEVQSGDCLTIIVSGGSKGTNNEIVLTLASLDAPRLSRRSGDAPFAHKSREFLRDKCAGQLVTFKVEYKVPTIGRTFGTVFVKGEDVSLAIVEAGLAAVKDPRGDCSGSIEALLALQEQAKAAGLGMWTSDKSTIAAASVKVRHAGDDDVTDDELEAIFKAIEDKPVEAIIECVAVVA